MVRAWVSAVLAAALIACGAKDAESAATVAVPAPQIGEDNVQTAQLDRRAPASRQEMQLSLAPVVSRASPAVVNIYAARVTRVINDPFMGRFGGMFGIPQEQIQRSLGSGVIVRADGVIVTNNHVVENAQQLKVILSDKREFDARIILTDPRTDLAVLRIDQASLPTLRFADTRQAQVGDLVLAIGNPFGLQQTVTSGIISALGRTDVGINDFSSFIQTDASINPGNSGGALVDMNGDLVGVNTAIFSRDGQSAGVGFAIPSEMVRRVVESAVTDGRVVRPWLGVRGQPVTQDIARALGLDRPRGVLVGDLYDGGPAARAGLQRGDVILAVGGVEVFDDQGVRFQAATQRPGASLAIEYMRGSNRSTVQARVEAPPRRPAPEPRELSGRNPLSGTRVLSLSPATAEDQGLDHFAVGVLIEAIDRRGIAAQIGLRPGDIIVEINGQAMRTTADVARALGVDTRQWSLGVERNGRREDLSLTL
jgi:Do/DeqQ family serine protease